eukprot:TRINITY_DN22387_c0_g2_i1.p1 TRINITY_DN22387_c0_g2~~TRINITY_DN22387_c0_g2_i1.p1  ORF type:complete len:515 (+),score=52.07 TRINITY_DN22387_c0_g2_i1:78-1622(+)
MPGVSSWLFGGGSEGGPGQGAPSGGGPPAGVRQPPAVKQTADLPAAAGGKEQLLRPCDGCGEMRKTTQGLCAACFLTGGKKAGGPRDGRRSNDSDGRLPGIQSQTGFGKCDNATGGTARATAQPATSRPKAQELKKSSSTTDVGGGSSGSKPTLGAMLAQQKEKKDGRDDGGGGFSANRTGFSAAQPSGRSQPGYIGTGSSSNNASTSGAARGPTSYRDAKERASAKARAELSPDPPGEGRAAEATAAVGAPTAAGAPSRGIRSLQRCVTLAHPAAALALAPELPGGFRRGDIVLSLISRMRQGSQILEFGNEGIVIGVPDGTVANDKDAKLLIQFKLGFDWMLAPHQVCHQAQYHALTAAGLPGGFKWGDRVRSLHDRLQPKGIKKSGLQLGDIGTVIGPGCTGAKLGIRFDKHDEEWSLWPNAVCKQEVYEQTVGAKLPGGFRRGDRVKSKSLRVLGGGAGGERGVEEGQEGVVVGPGHAPGRLLVCFDASSANWSVEPTALALQSSTKPET